MIPRTFYVIVLFYYTYTQINGEDDLAKDKRYSSFVRIGKSMLEDSNQNADKRYSSFVRIGKSPQLDKRLSSFVRIGKSTPDETEIEPMQQIDKQSKRLSSFVRIGKSSLPPYDVFKRLSSFVRIGKAQPSHKRYSSFVRIGKDGSGQMKRFRGSSFVRIGKSYNDEANLNTNDGFDGQQKRIPTSSFVRIGKAGEDVPEKRYSSFVRIGKNVDGNVDDLAPGQKRYSSFVRIGKNVNNDNTPSYMPYERQFDLIKDPSEISEGDESSAEPILHRRKRSTDTELPSKRGFIRIGKIPSSAFMRIGRNRLLDSLMFDNYVRQGRRGHSSFIRIGKRMDMNEYPLESSFDENSFGYLPLEDRPYIREEESVL